MSPPTIAILMVARSARRTSANESRPPNGEPSRAYRSGADGGATGRFRSPGRCSASHDHRQQQGGNSDIVPRLVGCGGRAGQSRPRGGDEPTGTITAKADGCVAVAFLAQNNYLEPGHDAREPLSTIVGRVSTQSPIVAFIAQHNGVSRPDGSEAARPGRDSGEPLATIAIRKPAEPRLRICGSPIRQLNRPCGRRTNRHRYGGRLRQVAARQTIPAGILRNRRRPARERADADCYHEGPPRPCRSDYQCSTVHRSAGERARQVAEFNRVSLRNMPV